MELLTNITSSKKAVVNATNATLGFKDIIGEPVKMTGVLIYRKEEIDEKSGEVKNIVATAIECEKDGQVIYTTSISPTVKNSIDIITSLYEEEEILQGINVMVKSKKSNGGRDFLFLEIL